MFGYRLGLILGLKGWPKMWAKLRSGLTIPLVQLHPCFGNGMLNNPVPALGSKSVLFSDLGVGSLTLPWVRVRSQEVLETELTPVQLSPWRDEFDALVRVWDRNRVWVQWTPDGVFHD